MFSRIHGYFMLQGILLLLIPLLGGCSSKTDPSDEENVVKTPVELVVYYPYSDTDANSFMDNYGNLIKSKYPHISFKWLNSSSLSLADLLLSGETIDIIYSNAATAVTFNDAEFILDLTELTKKHQLNLDQIEPATLDTIRKLEDGKLLALPFYINTHLTFYNKDLFDKFGVGYPKDQMTWDETYELTRRLTRLEDGVNYLGFSYYFLNGGFLSMNPYGENWMNPVTNQVTMVNGKWPDLLRNFQRFFQIPGNDYLASAAAVDGFAKEQRVAMQITLSNRIGLPEYLPANWDIVSYPVFTDLPGVGAGVDPIYFYVSTRSQHQEEAFLAISSLLSEEAQRTLLSKGRIPVVKLPDLAQLYATEVPSLKGKNTNALVANSYAPPITRTKEVIATQGFLGSAFLNVMNGSADINTALREATERANQKLAELKAAEGSTK